MTVEFPGCRHQVAADAILSGCSQFWREIDVVTAACPTCGDTTEARIEDSKITFGYTYAAASPHFAGMIEHSVPGLSVRRNGDTLLAEIAGRTWAIAG